MSPYVNTFFDDWLTLSFIVWWHQLSLPPLFMLVSLTLAAWHQRDPIKNSSRPNRLFMNDCLQLSLSLSLLSIYDNAQRWGCWKLCMTLNFFLLCVSLCFYLSTFFRSICPFVYVLNATSDCRHFWFIELWGVFKNI